MPALASSAVALFDYNAASVAIAPLGFTFTFYNVAYISVVVATNGNIQFATASTAIDFDHSNNNCQSSDCLVVCIFGYRTFVLLSNDWSGGSYQFLMRVPVEWRIYGGITIWIFRWH